MEGAPWGGRIRVAPCGTQRSKRRSGGFAFSKEVCSAYAADMDSSPQVVSSPVREALFIHLLRSVQSAIVQGSLAHAGSVAAAKGVYLGAMRERMTHLCDKARLR